MKTNERLTKALLICVLLTLLDQVIVNPIGAQTVEVPFNTQFQFGSGAGTNQTFTFADVSQSASGNSGTGNSAGTSTAQMLVGQGYTLTLDKGNDGFLGGGFTFSPVDVCKT